jgi:hypothetical protein
MDAGQQARRPWLEVRHGGMHPVLSSSTCSCAFRGLFQSWVDINKPADPGCTADPGWKLEVRDMQLPFCLAFALLDLGIS